MNYIARGYVSLSEEHHRSRSPTLSLRVRVKSPFFSSFLYLPSLSSPRPILSSPRAAFDGESFLSMVTRVCYIANIVCRDLRQVIIEYLSRLFLFLLPSCPFVSFFSFSSRSRAISAKKLFLSHKTITGYEKYDKYSKYTIKRFDLHQFHLQC